MSSQCTYCLAHWQDVGMESWCQSHTLQMQVFPHEAGLEYRFQYCGGHGDKGQVHKERLLHHPTNAYNDTQLVTCHPRSVFNRLPSDNDLVSWMVIKLFFDLGYKLILDLIIAIKESCVINNQLVEHYLMTWHVISTYLCVLWPHQQVDNPLVQRQYPI